MIDLKRSATPLGGANALGLVLDTGTDTTDFVRRADGGWEPIGNGPLIGPASNPGVGFKHALGKSPVEREVGQKI